MAMNNFVFRMLQGNNWDILVISLKSILNFP